MEPPMLSTATAPKLLYAQGSAVQPQVVGVESCRVGAPGTVLSVVGAALIQQQPRGRGVGCFLMSG